MRSADGSWLSVLASFLYKYVGLLFFDNAHQILPFSYGVFGQWNTLATQSIVLCAKFEQELSSANQSFEGQH